MGSTEWTQRRLQDRATYHKGSNAKISELFHKKFSKRKLDRVSYLFDQNKIDGTFLKAFCLRNFKDKLGDLDPKTLPNYEYFVDNRSYSRNPFGEGVACKRMATEVSNFFRVGVNLWLDYAIGDRAEHWRG